jgi:hypothetical protein
MPSGIDSEWQGASADLDSAFGEPCTYRPAEGSPSSGYATLEQRPAVKGAKEAEARPSLLATVSVSLVDPATVDYGCDALEIGGRRYMIHKHLTGVAFGGRLIVELRG